MGDIMEKYTGKKKFTITHESISTGITVVIDFDFNIKEKYSAYESMHDFIKSMAILFVGDLGNDFDYVERWLLYLADYTTKIDPFCTLDINKVLDKEDGYCSLDGSYGISLLDCNDIHNLISPEEYEIDLCEPA